MGESAYACGAISQRRPRGERHKGKFFAKLDVGGGGSISLAEAQGQGDRIADKFAALDGDGDGQLIRDEMRAGRGDSRGKRGRRDHDGVRNEDDVTALRAATWVGVSVRRADRLGEARGRRKTWGALGSESHLRDLQRACGPCKNETAPEVETSEAV